MCIRDRGVAVAQGPQDDVAPVEPREAAVEIFELIVGVLLAE